MQEASVIVLAIASNLFQTTITLNKTTTTSNGNKNVFEHMFLNVLHSLTVR
jgi:hypothetical protein